MTQKVCHSNHRNLQFFIDGVRLHLQQIIHPDEDRTVIHADEVIYHGDTGEIETRGDATITIDKAQ